MEVADAAVPVSMFCAPGWIEEASDDAVTCLPWSTRAVCDDVSAQRPGEDRCIHVGNECTPRFDSLTHARFVEIGASGDGSRERPFGTIADALAGIGRGDAIVLGAGVHAGGFELPAGVSLFGLCAGSARIAAPDGVAITVTGPDVVIRDLGIDGAITGIRVRTDASATIEGLIVRGIADRGVDVEPGATLVGRDLALRDFTGDSHENEPRQSAIYVNGGIVDLARIAIDRIVGTGVRIAGPDADVTIVDSSISDTTHGCGVRVAEGAARLERVAIERVHIAGVTVSTQPGHVELRDVVIRDVSAGWEYDWGFGVDARVAGSAVLDRVTVERVGGIGLMSFLSGSVEGSDVVVRDTIPRACGVEECLGEDFGVGAGAYQSQLKLDRFLIADAVLCGLQMARDSSVDLSSGEIRNNRIGANVQQPDYDVERLSAGVLYVGNGQNLDALDLPIPSRQLPP